MVSPDEGTTVVSATATFTVTPGDFNVGDPIFVKWITEYPTVVPDTSRWPTTDDAFRRSADGSPIRHAVDILADCFQVNRGRLDTSDHGGDLRSPIR